MAASFRERLRNGERLIGTMATIPSPATAEILSHIGFDWLFVDGEHGPLTSDSLLTMLASIGERTPCMVRTATADEAHIKQVLDLGAEGVIAPQVNSPDHAAAVVRHARYSPQGSRGVGLARAHGYGMRFKEYLERAQRDTTVIVQAEHRDAVEQIEKTIQVEGIDAILIGPYDLSASYGEMGQLDDPVVVDAIEHVTQVCRAAGMPLGIFGLRPAAIESYIAKGYNLLVAGVDTLILGQGATQLHDEMRAQIQ